MLAVFCFIMREMLLVGIRPNDAVVRLAVRDCGKSMRDQQNL
jgi:hypothetical protein